MYNIKNRGGPSSGSVRNKSLMSTTNSSREGSSIYTRLIAGSRVAPEMLHICTHIIQFRGQQGPTSRRRERNISSPLALADSSRTHLHWWAGIGGRRIAVTLRQDAAHLFACIIHPQVCQHAQPILSPIWQFIYVYSHEPKPNATQIICKIIS